jgi:hypothetical protein
MGHLFFQGAHIFPGKIPSTSSARDRPGSAGYNCEGQRQRSNHLCPHSPRSSILRSCSTARSNAVLLSIVFRADRPALCLMTFRSATANGLLSNCAYASARMRYTSARRNTRLTSINCSPSYTSYYRGRILVYSPPWLASPRL